MKSHYNSFPQPGKKAIPDAPLAWEGLKNLKQEAAEESKDWHAGKGKQERRKGADQMQPMDKKGNRRAVKSCRGQDKSHLQQ